jgi:hypothetical protein
MEIHNFIVKLIASIQTEALEMFATSVVLLALKTVCCSLIISTSQLYAL